MEYIFQTLAGFVILPLPGVMLEILSHLIERSIDVAGAILLKISCVEPVFPFSRCRATWSVYNMRPSIVVFYLLPLCVDEVGFRFGVLGVLLAIRVRHIVGVAAM
jgi:hypothetical protein